MNKHSDIKAVILDKTQIQKRVGELAAQISLDYEHSCPLMVCVLKGACMFFADLTRGLECDVMLDFVSLSSYGNSTRSTGQVTLVKDITSDISGKDIIIVEDIVDTGATMKHLIDLLKNRGAHSVRLCALLGKAQGNAAVKIDYLGFEAPDEFVVGYGLDFAEKYRNLDYIGILNA